MLSLFFYLCSFDIRIKKKKLKHYYYVKMKGTFNSILLYFGWADNLLMNIEVEKVILCMLSNLAYAFISK